MNYMIKINFLQSEKMDFKIHLYDLKEIKNILEELEFECFLFILLLIKKLPKMIKAKFLYKCK